MASFVLLMLVVLTAPLYVGALVAPAPAARAKTVAKKAARIPPPKAPAPAVRAKMAAKKVVDPFPVDPGDVEKPIVDPPHDDEHYYDKPKVDPPHDDEHYYDKPKVPPRPPPVDPGKVEKPDKPKKPKVDPPALAPGKGILSCELTPGEVTTFRKVKGSFLYPCMFKAATLYPMRVKRRFRLKVDIYAGFNGPKALPEVAVVVQDYDSEQSKPSTFRLNSPEGPKDEWDISGEADYSNYVCLASNQISIKKEKNDCNNVFASVVVLPPEEGNRLVITARKRKVPNEKAIEFPNHLCSGRRDKAFMNQYKGLSQPEPRILFALLEQNVPQSEPMCASLIQGFQALSEDDKKDVFGQCQSSLDLWGMFLCIAEQFLK